MAYTYVEQDLLEYFQSRIDTKIFVFRSATGAYKDDEDYDTRSQALVKVIEYDTKKLPLLPTTDDSTTNSDIIQFYYFDQDENDYFEWDFDSGIVATIDDNNKSAIPYGNPTADNIDIIKDATNKVKDAYNKIDKIVISALSDIGYERDTLIALIRNINNAFSLNIPTIVDNEGATIYTYDKVTKSWVRQIT